MGIGDWCIKDKRSTPSFSWSSEMLCVRKDSAGGPFRWFICWPLSGA